MRRGLPARRLLAVATAPQRTLSICPLTARAGGGESVDDVAARLRLFLACLEARHNGCNVVLVSHGDALSILAAVVRGTPLGAHRQHGLPNCGILKLP